MILIPLPHYGFDPTEAAVPWNYLVEKGMKIMFATPDGKPAVADQRLITGKGFGIFRGMLMADPKAIKSYDKMISSESFRSPISFEKIEVSNYKGIILPGGHDKGIKTYLGSTVLQQKVVEFFKAEKLVGAICHGTVLAARSIDPRTKQSVLYDYQTTSLLNSQELGAYYLTALWLKDYYRTYPMTVEEEVKMVLKSPKQFQSGKFSLRRDSLKDDSRAFVLQDKNYLSARWPGDARTFAKAFYKELRKDNI